MLAIIIYDSPAEFRSSGSRVEPGSPIDSAAIRRARRYPVPIYLFVCPPLHVGVVGMNSMFFFFFASLVFFPSVLLFLSRFIRAR